MWLLYLKMNKTSKMVLLCKIQNFIQIMIRKIYIKIDFQLEIYFEFFLKPILLELMMGYSTENSFYFSNYLFRMVETIFFYRNKNI